MTSALSKVELTTEKFHYVTSHNVRGLQTIRVITV